jgi:hypothetical protein
MRNLPSPKSGLNQLFSTQRTAQLLPLWRLRSNLARAVCIVADPYRTPIFAFTLLCDETLRPHVGQLSPQPLKGTKGKESQPNLYFSDSVNQVIRKIDVDLRTPQAGRLRAIATSGDLVQRTVAQYVLSNFESLNAPFRMRRHLLSVTRYRLRSPILSPLEPDRPHCARFIAPSLNAYLLTQHQTVELMMSSSSSGCFR